MDKPLSIPHRSDAVSPVDADSFRDTLSQFASGVTVVTTADPDGQPYGATISAFCSLSLHPALIQVSFASRSQTLASIFRSGAFNVNILGGGQAALAEKFASSSAGKFESVDWVPAGNGAPVLKGAVALIECVVGDTIVAGDHTIIIGAVSSVSKSEGAALIHFRRQYHAV